MTRCSRPVLDVRPLLGRDDARDQVEREDPVDSLVVAVDREADSLGQEEGVGRADPLAQPVVAERTEPVVQLAVVAARAARASNISSKNGPRS